MDYLYAQLEQYNIIDISWIQKNKFLDIAPQEIHNDTDIMQALLQKFKT